MNNRFHILIVDDEIEMLDLISSYLSKEQFIVSTALDGFELLKKIEKHAIDLVVLDVMMPEMDGFTVLQTIRNYSSIPVIMLTARGEESDKVHGLKIGADDYIVKPFSPKELVARIEALLRRTALVSKRSLLHVGDVLLDIEGRTVKVKGENIILTRKEYDLLLQLVKHKDQVLSREQLLDLVWGMDYAKGTWRTVDTHIKTLRIKLGSAGQYIKTVWGVGYKLESIYGE